MTRLLAYQHRLLSEQEYDPEFDDAQRDKFKTFLRVRMGLDIDEAVAHGKNKTVRFSYPDLHEHNPSEELSAWLKEEYETSIPGVTVNRVYAVYVKHDAPQIGFTAAVVFDISLPTLTSDGFRDLFVPERKNPARFHREFREVWRKYADKPQTIPVVIFDDELRGFSLWRNFRHSTDQFCGAPARIKLLQGQTARLERGFPYVSYVVHASLDSSLPGKIHRCDLALLMALPGFVERNLDLMVMSYRKELKAVQVSLEKKKFEKAERTYNKAWNSFERVQEVAPRTRAAVQRILQKYPGKSLFAAVAKDNVKLIEFTVTPAIAATEQVRANIQAFAQQKLQQSVRRMQFLTTFLTGILVAGTAVTAYEAVRGVAKMEITHIAQIAQPIRVSSEPIPDQSSVKTTIELTPLFKGRYVSKNTVILNFASKMSEAPVVLPTPMAAADSSPLELFLLQKDGAVVAEGTLATSTPPVAVKFNVARQSVKKDQTYDIQIQQDTWKLKLPVTLRYEK